MRMRSSFVFLATIALAAIAVESVRSGGRLSCGVKERPTEATFAPSAKRAPQAHLQRIARLASKEINCKPESIAD